jgi:hypothetical protein
MFGRHTDYHGTRSYIADESAQTTNGWFGLQTSLALAWVKLQFEKILRRDGMMPGNSQGFTLLGNQRFKRRSVREISQIFPVENGQEPRNRRPRKH